MTLASKRRSISLRIVIYIFAVLWPIYGQLAITSYSVLDGVLGPWGD